MSRPTPKRIESPCVLTIAGSDSGGGAGLQADSRTIERLGGFAATAVTAITAQGPKGVSRFAPVPPVLLAAQISTVLEQMPIRAIKTGLLPNAEAIDVVGRALAPYPQIPLVVDPVIGSTSGTRFLALAGVRRLRELLFPRATLLTPNWPEAAELTGRPIRNWKEAEAAAQALVAETGCGAVLIKGGHGSGRSCFDLLVFHSGEVVVFQHSRIKTLNTHGTGCVLSAAIATDLAHGIDLPDAVANAIEFMQAALAAGRDRNWNGAGPAFS